MPASSSQAVSRSCAIGAAKSVASPAIGSGVAAFSPSSLVPNQWMLDGGNAYEASQVNSYWPLRSLESYGTYRQPRGQACILADGVDDYIAVASLTGSETVISKSGTSAVSIAAGKINFTAGTAWDILLSNGSFYPCKEEALTTVYDTSGNAAHGTATNTTLSTFRSTSASVLINQNNAVGYRLASGAYIPKRTSSATLAADGNALDVTGKSPQPAIVETPCITGDGTAVFCPLFALSNITKVSMWVKTGSDFTGIRTPIYVLGTGSDVFECRISTGIVSAYARTNGGATVVTATGPTLTLNTWYFIEIELTTTSITLTLNGVPYATTGNLSGGLASSCSIKILSAASSSWFNGSVADLKIIYGGITRNVPLQDGPGSSNTNRDIAWYESSISGIVSNAITSGTVATIWGTRCPGYAKDHAVQYGGKLSAGGQFVLGNPADGNCADGAAKTLTAGKHGNPYSRVVPNSWSSPELAAIGYTAASKLAPSDETEGISIANTKFNRVKADGTDRYFSDDTALIGAQLTSAQGYVA